MLRIRAAQMAAFQIKLHRHLAPDLARILEARHPGLTAGCPKERFLQEIQARCLTACAYGLNSQAAIGDFVDLTFQLGNRFHEHPAVQAILQDPSLPGHLRMTRLVRTLTPSQWDEVRRFARGDAPAATP
jgi:hypothetical protein